VREFLDLAAACCGLDWTQHVGNRPALFPPDLRWTSCWGIPLKPAQAYRQQYGFRCISLMPTNLYGPGDNFDLDSSHVLPALIRKIHQAKPEGAPRVVIWGAGSPRREFLHVDDLADAALFLMCNYDEPEIVNVGFGEDITIRELAVMIARAAGFSGQLCFDKTRPDGTPRKLLDSRHLRRLGWSPKISLSRGIVSTYEWRQAHSARFEAHGLAAPAGRIAWS
jgi:GDP-L-fucose synthase